MPDKWQLDGLVRRFPDRITTVDSHTAGEPTRLIVDGLPPIPGDTMAAKRDYFRQHLDAVRCRLTREPRGHRDLLAAALTDPVTAEARFGLIYMDARRYPFLCGHATIGAVTTCLEAGWIEACSPETGVTVDTPSGPMTTRALVKNGRVTAVTIRVVPSFVYNPDQSLPVPGLGTLRAATVCVGGFFVMVSADQIDIPLDPQHGRRWIDTGMRIIEAANAHLTVRHPLRPEVDSVDVVEFYDPDGHRGRHGRSVVIYGEGHMDRSPCGTGTAATLTLMHHQGHLGPDQPYISRSPLGTTFEARIAGETTVGEFRGVEVEITGSAHLTGVHRFVRAPGDPLPDGFLL
jgi:proline racemase